MSAVARAASHGAVVAVRGSVVDVRFDDHLPPIYSLLDAGRDPRVVIEVLSQPDAHHVRGIALTTTQGLSRGAPVVDTEGPLRAPVGKAILARMFDVFGNVIDDGAPLSGVQWRSVHRSPPEPAENSSATPRATGSLVIMPVLNSVLE